MLSRVTRGFCKVLTLSRSQMRRAQTLSLANIQTRNKSRGALIRESGAEVHGTGESHSLPLFLRPNETDILQAAARRIRESSDATEVRSALREFEGKLDGRTYRKALQRVGFEMRQWKVAAVIFEDTTQRRKALKLDNADIDEMYECIVAVLANGRQLSAAMRYFRKFLKRNGRKPSGKLLRALLNRSVKESDSRTAEELFKAMIYALGMEPTVIDFTLLLKCHIRAAEARKALAVFRYLLKKDWINEAMEVSEGSGKWMKHIALEDCSNGEVVTAQLIWESVALLNRQPVVGGMSELLQCIEETIASSQLRLSAEDNNRLLTAYMIVGSPECVLSHLDSDEKLQQIDSLETLCIAKSAVLKLMKDPSADSLECDVGIAESHLSDTLERLHKRQMEGFKDQMSKRKHKRECQKLLFGRLLLHSGNWHKCVLWLKEFMDDFQVDVWHKRADGNWRLRVNKFPNLGVRALLRYLFSDPNTSALIRERFLDSVETDKAPTDETETSEATGDRTHESVYSGSILLRAGPSALGRLEPESLRDSVVNELLAWNPPLKFDEEKSEGNLLVFEPQSLTSFFESQTVASESDEIVEFPAFCSEHVS